MSYIKNMLPKHLELPINYDTASPSIRKLAREQYVKEQKGLCHFCGSPLTKDPRKDIKDLPINTKLFPQGMFDYPVHLHHCRKTGLTLGAVHCHCNAVLWQYHQE